MRGQELKRVRLENLRLLRERWTLEQIADLTGTNAVYLSQIANEYLGSNRKTPRALTDNYAAKIERGLGLESGWLDRPHESVNDTRATYETSAGSAPPGSRVAVWETLEDLPEGGAYVQVPHYDVLVSAGDGCTWVDHPDNEPLVFRASWFRSKRARPEDCRAIYVNGESMSPTLNDGDTVLIDTSRTAVRDDVVYAVLYADELYIKRLFRLPGGGLELRSDNPRHPSREVQGADVEQIRVLGQMIWRAG